MLFNHLDREKREKVSLDDISFAMKETGPEHESLMKRDWKDTVDKFNKLDTSTKGILDFQ